MKMPEAPRPPTLETQAPKGTPASFAELRRARAALLVMALIAAGLLAWHWIGGGALWLGLVFGGLVVLFGVGAASVHGQLHGWDAPDLSDSDDDHVRDGVGGGSA